MVWEKYKNKNVILIDNKNTKIYVNLYEIESEVINYIDNEEGDGGEELPVKKRKIFNGLANRGEAENHRYMAVHPYNNLNQRIEKFLCKLNKEKFKKIIFLKVSFPEYKINNFNISLGENIIKGIIHREDGPAIIGKNIKLFVKHSVISNINQPSMSHINGDCIYSINNIYHRDFKPAIINHHNTFNYPVTYINNTECYLTEIYILKNKIHRIDGPAVIWKNNMIHEFWIEGIFRYALIDGERFNNKKDFKNEIRKRGE